MITNINEVRQIIPMDSLNFGSFVVAAKTLLFFAPKSVALRLEGILNFLVYTAILCSCLSSRAVIKLDTINDIAAG